MSIETSHAVMAETSVDAQLFRRVCGRFASGITIVTVLDLDGRAHGLTANSFTSVSLAPSLVLVCVDHRSKVLAHLRRSSHFGINILAENQRPLADRFAGSGYDRFEGVEWHPGGTGVPLLSECLASLECRSRNAVEAGDHDIVIGQVLHIQCREGQPLIYFASQYRQLAGSVVPSPRER